MRTPSRNRRVPVPGPAPRGDRVSLFILCSFVLAGTLWITPEASYCLDALTAHRVVNPRPNPLQTTQPYRIFPARPTHSFHLSHRSGNLCRVSLFLFSVLFLHTIRNDRHGSAPGWPREPRLEQTSSLGNLTTRYLQQTRVSRIFQPQFLTKNGPAPWKPSFSVYYFVSLPFPIFLTV